MRALVGSNWERQYRTFGMRLVYLNWCYKNTYNATAQARFLRCKISGLPWVNSYDSKVKGRTRDQVIVNCIPFPMSDGNQRTFNLTGVVQAACEFQILRDDPYCDITISWANTEGGAVQFSTVAGLSYALPTMNYAFILWPIQGKSAKVVTHGFPLQKTKRLRLDDRDDRDDSEE